MKAAIIKEYGSISWEEVPAPELQNSDVLIRISYATICGTDQHILKGEFHQRTRLPLIPGHEFAGVIEETGSEVKKVKKGDKVVVDPIIWCGKCDACRAGHYPACNSLKIIGVDLDGGFAEFISVPDRMVYRVPDNIPDKYAALIEILSIGFHACNRAELKKNETVAIWGGGKVGHGILQAAKIKTRNKIFLIDILENRLLKALKAYPDIRIINARTEDPVEVIRDATRGSGVDVAFEAVGHADLQKDMVNPVRGCVQAIKGGGRVCVLGLSDDPAPVLMKELIWKEAKIIASRVSHGEFANAIDELSKGNLKPESMITSVLHPSEAQKAFELLESQPEKQLKILLEFQR